MNKYRSTINPLTIIVNIVLYAVLLILVYTKTREFFVFGCILVLLYVSFNIVKFLSYKYYLEPHGLVIIHKRRKMLILYKDIKYVELNSENNGMLYGYGVKRLLIGTGKNVEESYLITPEKEKEYIENLEIRVKNAKKGTN